MIHQFYTRLLECNRNRVITAHQDYLTLFNAKTPQELKTVWWRLEGAPQLIEADAQTLYLGVANAINRMLGEGGTLSVIPFEILRRRAVITLDELSQMLQVSYAPHLWLMLYDELSSDTWAVEMMRSIHASVETWLSSH